MTDIMIVREVGVFNHGVSLAQRQLQFIIGKWKILVADTVATTTLANTVSITEARIAAIIHHVKALVPIWRVVAAKPNLLVMVKILLILLQIKAVLSAK